MGKLPMDLELLPAHEDYIFKTIMTHPDAKPALMDLVSAVIGRKVLDITVINNELPISGTEEKSERLDVNCIIDDGSQVNVEMQGSKIVEPLGGHMGFFNKSVYYLSDLHSSQKSKGVDYDRLVRTYQITFTKYTVLPGLKNYFTQCSLRTPTGKQISDQLNMAIIELSKLQPVIGKAIGELKPIDMWSIFLGYASELKERKLINEIIEKKGELAMASAILTSISKDEHERAKFRSRLKHETEIAHNLSASKRIGIAQGIAQIARKMKVEGMPVESIAKLTNLPIKEIEQL